LAATKFSWSSFDPDVGYSGKFLNKSNTSFG
jgi:hypothetical protein